MTLILTVATDRKVIQASDRLVTLPNGTVYCSKANKAVAVTCQGSRFSISFVGTAIIAGKNTDEWIGDYLTNINAATLSVKPICDALMKQLSKCSHLLSPPSLSLILCGFVGQDTFAALISNFEYWKPNKIVPPQPNFHGEVTRLIKGVNPKKALALYIHGYEKAITEGIKYKLRRLRKRRFFQNSDSNTVAFKLVELIREASRTPDHGKYIGRDCLSIAISRNLSDDVEIIYYPEKESPIWYGPYLIDPIGSKKGIEIEGIKEVKFPTN